MAMQPIVFPLDTAAYCSWDSVAVCFAVLLIVGSVVVTWLQMSHQERAKESEAPPVEPARQSSPGWWRDERF